MWRHVAWQIVGTVSERSTFSVKVTAVGPFETAVNFRQDTRSKYLKVQKIQNYCCEKLSCQTKHEKCKETQG
jgi:hypothetical protein